MADRETRDDACEPRDVYITMVVEPGRMRAALARLGAGQRARAGLASVGLTAAVVSAVIIALSSSGGGGRSLAAIQSPAANSRVMATRFGIRVSCPRLTIVSPDRAYGRVDFGLVPPCGTSGNHVTLIVHRVHDAWVPEFETSGWTCPMRSLPQRVVSELHLCG
jgi:hypothetical protein